MKTFFPIINWFTSVMIFESIYFYYCILIHYNFIHIYFLGKNKYINRKCNQFVKILYNRFIYVLFLNIKRFVRQVFAKFLSILNVSIYFVFISYSRIFFSLYLIIVFFYFFPDIIPTSLKTQPTEYFTKNKLHPYLHINPSPPPWYTYCYWL